MNWRPPANNGRLTRKGGFIAAVGVSGACFVLSGCLTRYARIIAMSSPPLANVKIGYPPVPKGPAPAFIDEKARFLFFVPQRRTYTLIFDHDNCQAYVTTIPIEKWGKTAQTGPLNVTSVKANLTCGQQP